MVNESRDERERVAEILAEEDQPAMDAPPMAYYLGVADRILSALRSEPGEVVAWEVQFVEVDGSWGRDGIYEHREDAERMIEQFYGKDGRVVPLVRAPTGAGESGVDLIAAERKRQIEVEGWTPDHDDEHVNGEMAMSAVAYAWPPDITVYGVRRDQAWPFGSCDWKPGDRIRELTKAGALIAAEIDRLQRAAPGPEREEER
jgi:hypothetical protein